MRIVGGKFKGRAISAPKGQATRPTTDRTRESLFNILVNKIDLQDCRVLDLFAGTGALGLEAISRGAGFCLFVEDANAARGAIRGNVEALGLNGHTKIFKRDATKLGTPGTMKPFDLIFADPPYVRSLGEKTAKALLEGGWCNPDALFVLEEATQSFPDSLSGFELDDKRTYGDTTIGFFRLDRRATKSVSTIE